MEKVFDFGDYLYDGFAADIAAMEKYGERSTGFDNLDKVQIFVPALYVLGGMTGMGKTTWAWQMAFELAVNGEKVVYCSFEMSKLDLTAKMIAREIRRSFDERNFGLPASKIRTGALEFEDNSWLNDRYQKFRYDYSLIAGKLSGLECSCTVEELLETLEAEVKDAGDKRFTVVVDYLQLVGTSDKKATTPRERIDSVIIQLKRFQQAHNATVIVLSAFNRSSAITGNLDTRLSSFKESGGIEYTADVVWGLQPYKAADKHAGDLNDFMRETPRRIELSCLKNRYGGLYMCYYKYYSQYDYFRSCDKASELIGEPAQEEEPTKVKIG